MRLLAVWFGNPAEYWMNIVILIAVVAVGVWLIRKFGSSRSDS